MGVFAYIKNGTKYKMNQFPGAYPANRVSYNGSDVKTALDEINADMTKNTFENSTVQMESYTTVSNPFTCPSDGYIKLYCAEATGQIGVDVITENNTATGMCTLYHQQATTVSFFVRKGMKFIVSVNSGTGNTARFRGIK